MIPMSAERLMMVGVLGRVDFNGHFASIPSAERQSGYGETYRPLHDTGNVAVRQIPQICTLERQPLQHT